MKKKDEMNVRRLFKLYRKLSTEAVWSDILKLRLGLQCLMKAAYKDKEIIIENQVFKLKSRAVCDRTREPCKREKSEIGN